MANWQISSLSESPIKVLVVDDHPNTANMLARAISRLGPHVEVVSVTSGIEALHRLDVSTVDILITDMMMPEMTGMELIEKLNDNPSISPMVTFLLTAHDSAGVREIARRLNVKDVISKPARPEQICELISQTIGELKSSKTAKTKIKTHKEIKPVPGVDTAQTGMNVSQLLWEAAKKLQPQADLKDHLLAVGKTDPDSIVHGNPVQLRQALRSLVWVAIHNTPNGGTVILSSENEVNTVKIFVRETGYGEITETESMNQDLETVKSIANQHGGDVIVESEVGKGTCFTMSLPILPINTVASLAKESDL